MNTEKQGAQSLVERAMQSGRQSEAEMLINAARRLDPSVNADELRNQWLEKWLIENKDRKEIQARGMIAQRSTYQLVLDWEQSEKTQMTDELPTVRGWLMDELERRNPVAFSCWLESHEISPRKFFCV